MIKRTFIAQVIPVTSHLSRVADYIRNNLRGMNVKWVDYSNLHLTLAFLGDTTGEQTEKISKSLEAITVRYSPYSIRLTNPGTFKNLRHPEVIWIGVEAEKTLENLYADTQNLAESLGFKKDTRPFKPHLTLGRVKSYMPENNLKEILENNPVNESLEADRVVYYESILSPSGPKYLPIQTYKLKKP